MNVMGRDKLSGPLPHEPNWRTTEGRQEARGRLIEAEAEVLSLRRQLQGAVVAARAVTAGAETLVVRDDVYDVRVPAEAWNVLRRLGGQS